VSRITIVDELTKDKVTTLDFSAPTAKNIPEDFFSVERLKGTAGPK
jgi:hypothetical protein